MSSDWYAKWMEDKSRYARTDEPFMDKDRFHSLTVGTGLPSIDQRSTFSFHGVQEGADRFSGARFDGEAPYARIYTRLGNPTAEYLEKLLLRLDGEHILQAAGGDGRSEPLLGAMIFASGMAAITMTLMALLSTDQELLCADVVYSSTTAFLKRMGEKFGLKAHFVNTADLQAVADCLEANPRVAAIFLETPDNPTLKVTDIQAVADMAAKRHIPLVVDNTFATPYLQQPLRLGADIAIQSMTKYINGHSTAVGGCVVGPYGFVRHVLYPLAKDIGACTSPFEAWLNATNVQTLGHRMEIHCASAARLARLLDKHERITKVYYPGLESHPQHALAARQMRLPGAMISFELENGFEAAQKLMNYFARPDTPMELAVSLGSTISYIQHPASMTHASVPREERLASGITDELVRFSVGLEGVSLLETALLEGLTQAYA